MSFFVGYVGSDLCFNVLNRFVEVESHFGIPLAEEKTSFTLLFGIFRDYY